MNAKRQPSADALAVLRESKGLRIQAGIGQHRFIGIWVVVVKGRVFVRSWSVKPNGWYRTFLKEPRGMIKAADRKIEVRSGVFLVLRAALIASQSKWQGQPFL